MNEHNTALYDFVKREYEKKRRLHSSVRNWMVRQTSENNFALIDYKMFQSYFKEKFLDLWLIYIIKEKR